jgi:nucleoside-diphosphate-sugar epimerase
MLRGVALAGVKVLPFDELLEQLTDIFGGMSRPKKILVSGATGFIGRRLLEFLCEAGLQPVALARSSSDTVDVQRFLDRPEFGGDIFRVAELLEPNTLGHAVKDVDAIVHLAADVDFFPRDPNRLVRVNVDGTRHLLHAFAAEAAARDCKLPFVYISSTEAIGPTDPGQRAPEGSILKPDCEYGRSKVLAEAAVLSRESANSLDVCILRLTGVYGVNEKFFFSEMTSMVAAGLMCVSPGPLNGRVMFSHVDDVCKATLLVLRGMLSGKQMSRIYNVCPDDDVSYWELIETIATCVGRAPPAFRAPLAIAMPAMSLLAPLLNLGKRRVFVCHPKSLKKTTTLRVYSNKRIKRELGYAPVPNTLGAVRSVIAEEIAAGRISVTPVSPLVMNFTKVLSLVLFGAARLWMSSQDSAAS